MLNLAKKLYDLQAIDLEIKKVQSAIYDIDQSLEDDSKLRNAKQEITGIAKELGEIERNKKDLEWTIDDLQKSIKQINVKLYGGTVKSPKELMGFEQEVKAIKQNLKEKEDKLLDLMTREETLLKQKRTTEEQLKSMENEWQQEKKVLLADRKNMEKQLNDLSEQRQQDVSSIDDETMKTYEKISSKKGYAVVRVEQGKCQGCRLSISMSEMQRARSGAIVQCSSCGMILYL
jgi:predicted  nucleic acid-binding Zn-ribbon protein